MCVSTLRLDCGLPHKALVCFLGCSDLCVYIFRTHPSLSYSETYYCMNCIRYFLDNKTTRLFFILKAIEKFFSQAIGSVVKIEIEDSTPCEWQPLLAGKSDTIYNLVADFGAKRILISFETMEQAQRYFSNIFQGYIIYQVFLSLAPAFLTSELLPCTRVKTRL